MTLVQQIDLPSLRRAVERYGRQALRDYEQFAGEETYHRAYGRLDGFFHGALEVCRAAGLNPVDNPVMETVREVTGHFQAELIRLQQEQEAGGELH